MSMALDALRDACSEVDDAQRAYRETLDARNDLIKDAYESGIKYRNLMRITGLSREQLSRITLGKPYSKDRE